MGPGRWGDGPTKRIIYEGLYPSPEETEKGWAYFWSKNRLSYNLKGEKYRTDEPRVMPVKKDLDFRRKNKNEW